SRGLRYDAACAAVLAGCGQGEDAARPDEAQRALLRRQALAWLRADLDVWTARLEADQPGDRDLIQGKMRHWRQDADLTGVRDAGGLVWLSESERAEWLAFWRDVEALRKRAAEPK